ncbi:hypothetical protein DEU56DRAFT_716518, partial [Suillus clintonianus]|uniref:uncharacterized protein n=1 Tax=Suillus clintonianus TaxID=1904413 RepID=UPI001B868F5D
MLKMAKKHNMSFAPIKVSHSLKQQLPAWFHLGAPPRTYNKIKDQCLQQVHKIRTVNDLMKLKDRRTTNTNHRERSNCACEPCKNDRIEGCKNPHKCTITALTILTKLSQKLNPLDSPPDDGLTLTHRRKEKNARAISQQRGDIVFDPSITEKKDLSECFRIFTKTTTNTLTPAYR